MRNHVTHITIVAATVAIIIALFPGIRGTGQTPSGGGQGTPDGKPDLNGIWQAFTTATWGLEDHNAQKGEPGGQGIVEGGPIPYQPWALAKRNENYKNRMTADPVRKCYMPGVPRTTFMPFPFEIVQSPALTVITYEYNHLIRWIWTDGRKHPEALNFWMGESRGRWEGDTLIVDVRNHNDQTWLDAAGDFHSEALHVVERYTLAGRDHINYEVTFEDPTVFTRPWKVSTLLYRRLEKNVQLLDYDCLEFETPFLRWDEPPAPGLPAPPAR
jgi:hypothetical protein